MGINPNHNQTLVRAELSIRIVNHNQTVARPVPFIRIPNHNQTVVRPRPQIVVGFDPGLATNHNQTVARPVPGLSYNHQPDPGAPLRT